MVWGNVYDTKTSLYFCTIDKYMKIMNEYG